MRGREVKCNAGNNIIKTITFGKVKVEARLSLRGNTERRVLFLILKQREHRRTFFFTGSGMITFGFNRCSICRTVDNS